MDEFNISKKLRNARMKKKMNMKALAREIGCSTSLISLIENGKISPPIKTLSSIAKALDISLKDLFEEDEERVVFEITSISEGRQGTGGNLPPGIKPVSPEPRQHPAIRNRRIKHNFIRLPNGNPHYLKYLHSEESLVYVIRGKAELFLGEHTIPLEAGDSIYFETTVPHGFRSRDDSEVLILEVDTAA